jgi:hypothetical protein
VKPTRSIAISPNVNLKRILSLALEDLLEAFTFLRTLVSFIRVKEMKTIPAMIMRLEIICVFIVNGSFNCI